MMGPGTWRDLFRLRCRWIAGTERTSEGLTVRLCSRWRFHRGVCR